MKWPHPSERPIQVRAICSSCAERVELDNVVCVEEDTPRLVYGTCLACGRLVEAFCDNAYQLAQLIARGVPTVAQQAHYFLEKASA